MEWKIRGHRNDTSDATEEFTAGRAPPPWNTFRFRNLKSDTSG